MIVERLSFQAKYGQGDTLVALFREWEQLMGARAREMGMTGGRLYTDATGTMFTVEVESEFESWEAYARYIGGEQAIYGTAEFQDWFARMMGCTERGSRQLFNVEAL